MYYRYRYTLGSINCTTSAINRFLFTIIMDFIFIHRFNAEEIYASHHLSTKRIFRLYLRIIGNIRFKLSATTRMNNKWKKKHKICHWIKNIWIKNIFSELLRCRCEIAKTLPIQKPSLLAATETSTMRDHSANLFKLTTLFCAQFEFKINLLPAATRQMQVELLKNNGARLPHRKQQMSEKLMYNIRNWQPEVKV